MSCIISKYEWDTLNPDAFPLKIISTQMLVSIPKHSHDFHELVIFMRGSAIHKIYQEDGTLKSYSVVQGDVFAIRQNEQHSFENGHSAFYYNIIFRSELLQSELRELEQFPLWKTFFGDSCPTHRMKSHLSPVDRAEVMQKIQALNQELEFQGDGFRFVAKTLFLEILAKILRGTRQPILQNEDFIIELPILQCIGRIEDAPEKRYYLPSEANSANMSIASFTRKFRQATGCSMQEYIKLLRLKKAENLLMQTNINLEGIAAECGFYDTNYFIKVFKQQYKTTPAKFRVARTAQKDEKT
ncbi:MAG: helix-turn-helix domain-containing protein [Oligosphaeraceae bacterium]|nr:helix-turn-helix domain-containing protein [Oligosphaeraceae bacterium]